MAVRAQAGQSVFVSRDSGTNWTEVALPGNPVVSALTIPSKDTVFAGTRDGRMFRIDWANPSWQNALELASPRSAWISDIFADPNNARRLWATSTTVDGGRVFRSDDGAATWYDVSAGLPNLPVNAIEADPKNPNRIWIATDLGVYETLDAGATWRAFGSGLPNALVEDLRLHPQARLLRAATRNRGVWEIAVDAAPSAAVSQGPLTPG